MSESLQFYKTATHPCSYLDEEAESIFLDPEVVIDSTILETLNLNGFRRSGKHVYRPHCKTCQACESSRILVDQFIWRRSFKRILKRNQDLSISIKPANYIEEHFKLFETYINERHHDGDMYPTSEQQYRDFLLQGYKDSFILEYRLKDRLIGCTVIDVLHSGISAIYTWFDPEESDRSIGSLAILETIRLAIRQSRPYVYLGYWIKNCSKMAYKSRFQPLETFKNGIWTEFIN